MTTKYFNGFPIRVKLFEDSLMFHAQDVSDAVGYKHIRSLYHHLSEPFLTKIDGFNYLSSANIAHLSVKAYKTPTFKLMKTWAANFKPEDFRSNKLYGISEAAMKLGLNIETFTEYLIEKGYAERYISNNHLKWAPSFVALGLGRIATIGSASIGDIRSSNVPKLTEKGMTKIVKDFEDQRKNGVLAFGINNLAVNLKISGMTVSGTVNDRNQKLAEVNKKISEKMMELSILFEERAKLK